MRVADGDSTVWLSGFEGIRKEYTALLVEDLKIVRYISTHKRTGMIEGPRSRL
jgi:hypothetical protein